MCTTVASIYRNDEEYINDDKVGGGTFEYGGHTGKSGKGVGEI